MKTIADKYPTFAKAEVVVEVHVGTAPSGHPVFVTGIGRADAVPASDLDHIHSETTRDAVFAALAEAALQDARVAERPEIAVSRDFESMWDRLSATDVVSDVSGFPPIVMAELRAAD